MRSEIEEIEDEIAILEIQIDETMWGQALPRPDGVRPSMFNYWPEIYREEIEQDPSMLERLKTADEIQSRIRELEIELKDLKEQARYEEDENEGR